MAKIPHHIAGGARRVRRYARVKLADRRTISPHRSFRLTRRSEMPRYRSIPAWWRLVAEACRQLWRVRTTVILLVVLYSILNWLVNGIDTLKSYDTFRSIATSISFNSIDGVASSFSMLSSAVGTLQSQEVPAQLMIGLLQLLFWLGFIWLVRHAYARKATTLRETMYLSGSALVPTILGILIICVQALPGIIGLVFGATIFKDWGLDTAIQSSFFALLALLLITLSAYLIVSGLVALQIVALPGSYPMRALRDARTLVAGRRLATLRKYLIVPLLIAVLWLALLMPFVWLDGSVCANDGGVCWVMPLVVPTWTHIVTALSIGFAAAYAYVVYRALLASREVS